MKRRGTSNTPPCKQRPPSLAGRLFTARRPKVTHPFLFGAAFASKLLGLASRESGRRADAGVRGVVVVGIAVVVDIAPVRGIPRIHREYPPVVAATQEYFQQKITVCYLLFFENFCRAFPAFQKAILTINQVSDVC